VEPDGAADEVGEILVRGAMVFAGYVDDEQATAAALRGGWLHTGDIGTIDDAGLLRITDRRDDLIVSGGENVYPAQVEAVLVAHPTVAEAAVVASTDERWGHVPVAFVVVEQGAIIDPVTLEHHCQAQLAGYKVPVRFEPVEALPRNSLGKVLRQELRDRLAVTTA
jgi:O-succinylbenzoic acid--CoA ligase